VKPHHSPPPRCGRVTCDELFFLFLLEECFSPRVRFAPFYLTIPQTTPYLRSYPAFFSKGEIAAKASPSPVPPELILFRDPLALKPQFPRNPLGPRLLQFFHHETRDPTLLSSFLWRFLASIVSVLHELPLIPIFCRACGIHRIVLPLVSSRDPRFFQGWLLRAVPQVPQARARCSPSRSCPLCMWVISQAGFTFFFP